MTDTSPKHKTAEELGAALASKHRQFDDIDLKYSSTHCEGLCV
ncbi:hypothetical protein [Deinococcus alpinitundrae]|nr:hypothetical protein [Deinococcus alpinitundrae]